jgi:hypothetical protein
MPGFILYEGPSELDGAPIVAIAITSSDNRKTGDMHRDFQLTIDIRVHDEQRLYEAARAQYLAEGGKLDDADFLKFDDGEIDVGACLVHLLDRSEHLNNGAEILNSSTEEH